MEREDAARTGRRGRPLLDPLFAAPLDNCGLSN